VGGFFDAPVLDALASEGGVGNQNWKVVHFGEMAPAVTDGVPAVHSNKDYLKLKNNFV